MAKNISKLTLFVAVSIIFFSNVYCFEILNTPTCQGSNNQQSPIDVDPYNTFYREEKYFHLIQSNYSAFNATWMNFPDEKAVGFLKGDNENWGHINFVKDWSIYKFDLKKILFRYRSGHTIDGRRYDIEMELFHEIDTSFRTSGRYIHPSSNQLIISAFFMADSNGSTSEKSNFFNYTNIEKYTEQTTSGVYFTRMMKLSQIIQNSGSYFYEGANTYGNCTKAWRLLLPKYQLIYLSQYQNLRTIISKLGYIDINIPSSSNSRNQQAITSNTRVYRNVPTNERILIEQNYHQYVKSQGFEFGLFAFFISLIIMIIS